MIKSQRATVKIYIRRNILDTTLTFYVQKRSQSLVNFLHLFAQLMLLYPTEIAQHKLGYFKVRVINRPQTR